MSPKMYSSLIAESLKTMTLAKNTQAVELMMKELDFNLLGIKPKLYDLDMSPPSSPVRQSKDDAMRSSKEFNKAFSIGQIQAQKKAE